MNMKNEPELFLHPIMREAVQELHDLYVKNDSVERKESACPLCHAATSIRNMIGEPGGFCQFCPWSTVYDDDIPCSKHINCISEYREGVSEVGKEEWDKESIERTKAWLDGKHWKPKA